MRKFIYQAIIVASRKLGLWVFILYAWLIATGFFILFPFRVATSVRFYRILFNDRDWYFHLWCAWRQFHNFTDVFFDRFLLHEFNDISYSAKGWEHLEKALKKKSGGILLMSHMGNWEIAAHLLKSKKRDLKLLLYMGVKQKEQIEKIQKESLSQSGIKIIAVDQEGGSPFDIVEAITFIESDGLVSLTGDLLLKKDQRTVPVKLLGHEVLLPQAPYMLALLSGAPLFVFFAFRTGKKQYHFTMSAPIYVQASSRDKRAAAIAQAAQKYADILETKLLQHPFQWYHFKPFFYPKR
ncbi:MAG: lauroyl acyltransferase [Desulfobacterales bacterium]